MDRWHHSQSDAVRRINECAMVTALERFWGGRRSQFDWVCLGKIFFFP